MKTKLSALLLTLLIAINSMGITVFAKQTNPSIKITESSEYTVLYDDTYILQTAKDEFKIVVPIRDNTTKSNLSVGLAIKFLNSHEFESRMENNTPYTLSYCEADYHGYLANGTYRSYVFNFGTISPGAKTPYELIGTGSTGIRSIYANFVALVIEWSGGNPWLQGSNSVNNPYV